MTMQNAKFKAAFKERVYAFVLRLITLIDALPKDSVCDVMGRQLLRSDTSILANYVEAGSASSKRDFINFFNHSLKSSTESKVWLALLMDTHKGNLAEINSLLGELHEIANIIASSILTMKAKA